MDLSWIYFIQKSGVRVVETEGLASSKAQRQKGHCARATAMRIHWFSSVPLGSIPIVVGKLLKRKAGKNFPQTRGKKAQCIGLYLGEG